MRVGKNEIPKTIETDETVMHQLTLGDIRIEFNVFKENLDVTKLLKGLPVNNSSPSWGIVMKGQIHIGHNGTEEIASAGDAYYIPSGFRVVADAGTEVWEFGPADKMEQTLKVIKRNIEEAQKKNIEQQNRLYSFFFPNLPVNNKGSSKKL